MRITPAAVAALAAAAITGCSAPTTPTFAVNGIVEASITGVDAYANDGSCRVPGTTGTYEQGSLVTIRDAEGAELATATLSAGTFERVAAIYSTCTWKWSTSLPETDGDYVVELAGGKASTIPSEGISDGWTIRIQVP